MRAGIKSSLTRGKFTAHFFFDFTINMADLDLPIPPSDVIAPDEPTEEDLDDSFYCPIR